MVEIDTIELDVIDMEFSTSSTLNNEKNNHKNLDVESKIEVTNKRSRDESVYSENIENSAKKLRQETDSENVINIEINNAVEKDADGIIKKEKLLDNENKSIQQINYEKKNEDIETFDNEKNSELVKNDPPDKKEVINEKKDLLEINSMEEECIVKLENVKTESVETNIQEDESIEAINDRTNSNIIEDDPLDKKKTLEEKNNQLEMNSIEEEDAVTSEEVKDISVEIYIHDEIEKGVKESMKKWLQVARSELIEECKLAVITKEVENEKKDKEDAEEMLDSEQEKKSNFVENIEKDSKKQNKKTNELIKAILEEKELEEKEKLLKLKKEKLKIFEIAILKEEEEIKEKRKQNQVWLEKRLKEWENEEIKSAQKKEQDLLIQNDYYQENFEPSEGEIKNDIEEETIETRDQNEIENMNLLNKLRELQKTTVKNEKNFLKREGRRPDQMSPGEWTQEDKERKKRRRNVKIKGLNPRNWRTGREIQDFFRREMRVKVTVENVTRVGMDLVVGFRNLSEKMEVLRKRAKVKNCGIWIGDDLTLREEEVQEWLKNEADWLRLKGRSVKLGHLKMIINGQRWIWNEVKGDLVPEVF